MVALKKFRNSKPSFSDLLPYAGLVDDGIILLKDGSLMAGWYFAGPDSESSTNVERNEVSRQINTILSRLGTGWMIQVEAIRVPTTAYPARDACHFPDPVTRAIDEERRAHFEAERGHYESQHALILTYRPPEPRRSAMARYVYSDEESRSETYANRVLNSFQTSIREVEQYLGNVLSIRRMVTRTVTNPETGSEARYDELFQFIRFCILGAELSPSVCRRYRCISTGWSQPSSITVFLPWSTADIWPWSALTAFQPRVFLESSIRST